MEPRAVDISAACYACLEIRNQPGQALPAGAHLCVLVTRQRHACLQCLTNPNAHSARIVGFDKLNRPIIYTCFGQGNDRFDPELNAQHTACVLEDAIRLMDEMNRVPGAARVEQWVWIQDFEGFSVKDFNPKIMTRIGKVRARRDSPQLTCAAVQRQLPGASRPVSVH